MPVACRGLVLTHLILVTACASSTTSRASDSEIVATDPVDFIVLGRGSRIDCAGRRADGTVCRMRENVSIPEIRRRLATGNASWREGDALVFAYEGRADAVDLRGTLEYPLSRVRGTDIWVVKLRIDDIDRALISYDIVPLGGDRADATDVAMRTWRGPDAPPEAPRSSLLRGRVIADSIDSRALGHVRATWVYLPPGNGAADGVIYLGDGRAVERLAPYVDTLISAGSLPRLMLVGMQNAVTGPGDPPRSDPRSLEYLWNHDTLNTRFLAHERFFLDEVMPWAESRHGAPASREQRAVFGVSNGGGWAMQMGLRNPEHIGHVIAFSPGGVRSGHMTPAMRFTPAVRFFLLAGTLEPDFRQVAEVWVDELDEKGLEYRAVTLVAGHDWNVWRNEFGGALEWAFGTSRK